MVADRLVLGRSLTAQLEAPQRPGDLVGVRSATRDEIAEGAQLVLLLGADQEHPVGAPACAERHRVPGSGADPRPGERAERYAAVTEQAQGAQQLAYDLDPVRDARVRVGILGGEDDQQAVLLTGGDFAQSLLGRPMQSVGLGDQETPRQRNLGRGDRQTVERRHERELGGRGGECRVLQTLQGSLEALGMAIEQAVEVGLLGAHLLQESQ